MPAALSRFGTLTEFDTLAEFDKVAEYSFGSLLACSRLSVDRCRWLSFLAR